MPRITSPLRVLAKERSTGFTFASGLIANEANDGGSYDVQPTARAAAYSSIGRSVDIPFMQGDRALVLTQGSHAAPLIGGYSPWVTDGASITVTI